MIADELVRDILDEKLVPEVVGGADWSVEGAWFVDRGLRKKLLSERTNAQYTEWDVFLVDDDGDLYFVARLEDEEAGELRVEELEALTAEDLQVIARRR